MSSSLERERCSLMGSKRACRIDSREMPLARIAARSTQPERSARRSSSCRSSWKSSALSLLHGAPPSAIGSEGPWVGETEMREMSNLGWKSSVASALSSGAYVSTQTHCRGECMHEVEKRESGGLGCGNWGASGSERLRTCARRRSASIFVSIPPAVQPTAACGGGSGASGWMSSGRTKRESM